MCYFCTEFRLINRDLATATNSTIIYEKSKDYYPQNDAE